MIDMYINYRRNVEKKPNPQPKRIIFYRGELSYILSRWSRFDVASVVDGVSEGQFRQVLEHGELSFSAGRVIFNDFPSFRVTADQE